MAMRLISILVSFVLVFSLVSCGQDKNIETKKKVDVVKKEEEKTKKEDKSKEEEQKEKVISASVQSIDENISDDEDDSDDIEDIEDIEGVKITLNADEQYEINIFLSNFAEQSFKKYDTNNVDDLSLIYFAYVFTRLNNHHKVSIDKIDGNYYETVTLSEINRVLDKYLEKKVSAYEGQIYVDEYTGGFNSKVFFQNGKLHFPAADGESFPEFAVVDEMVKLPDGTYKVEFNVYSIEKYSTGGNMVDDKNYYYYTVDQAENSSEMDKVEEGTAVVKYVGGRYKLLKYDEIN